MSRASWCRGLIAAVMELWQLPPREVLSQVHQLLPRSGMCLCLLCLERPKLRSALDPGVLGDVPLGPVPRQPDPGSARPGTALAYLRPSGCMMLSRASSERLMLVSLTAPLPSPW